MKNAIRLDAPLILSKFVLGLDFNRESCLDKRCVEHLQSIHDYIAQNSDVYADHVVENLLSSSQQISEFPNSGRVVPEFQDKNIREVISRLYRIIYRIKTDQIDVLAIVHGAQQFCKIA